MFRLGVLFTILQQIRKHFFKCISPQICCNFEEILCDFSFKTRYNLRESDKTNSRYAQLKSTKFAYLSVDSSLGRVKQ